MPADEFTRAHFKAIKACLEVADPGLEPGSGEVFVGSPEAIHKLAEEGLQVLLQHHPELGLDEPLDQLGEQDKFLLREFIDASNQAFWEADQGNIFDAERANKKFLEWQQLLIERLNR